MQTVLYTQRVEVVENYQERRDCADQRIADFIAICGFLPVPVPNKSEILENFVRQLRPAGIVLTGGNSLEKYGGNAPERDRTDQKLIEIALEKDIPLYGFCRGMQSILDYFGNDLVEVKGHIAVRHNIYGENGTKEVNSFHGQACVKLADESELKVVSRTVDNVIEEICHQKYFICGTMWHPEREKEFQETDIMNIKKLFGRERL